MYKKKFQKKTKKLKRKWINTNNINVWILKNYK